MPETLQTAALTEAEIALLRQSLELLRSKMPRAATRFYQRLFDIAPELRVMFKSDLGEQGHKFMAALSTLVDHIGDSDRLLPHLRLLAEGHKAYGVMPEHFRPMGQALVETLQEELGDSMPAGAADLWRRVYNRIAGEMISLGAGS